MNRPSSPVPSPRSSRSPGHPPAVILGLDDARGLYAARHLAGRGVPVVGVFGTRLSVGSFTRACVQKERANTESDGSIERLEQIGKRLGERAVLFPCFDSTALLVARHRSRLEESYHIAQPPFSVLQTMVDKVGFYQEAEARGFAIPRTRLLHLPEEVEQAADELRFPCVLKPPNSKDPRWLRRTTAKAFRLEDPGELVSLVRRYRDASSGPLLVQEWIEGPESNIYACHTYFDADSRPLVTFTLRKLRQWPPHVGDASIVEATQDVEVEKTTVDLFRSFGYQGLGSLELKRDARSGELFVIEPDVRLTAHGGVVEAGGVDLVYAMYCDLVGIPLPPNLAQSGAPTRWMFLRKDAQAGLRQWKNGEITPGEWWRSVRSVRAEALFAWNDPAPFAADLLRGLLLAFSPSRWGRGVRRKETRGSVGFPAGRQLSRQ